MKKVMFAEQAVPEVKRHPHHWPSLNVWLYSIGLTDKDIQENFPFPHPSGASTWIYKEGNKLLLQKALTIFKKEI